MDVFRNPKTVKLEQECQSLKSQINELELQAGLSKIALEHKSTLLESCENALSEREQSLDTLKAEIIAGFVKECSQILSSADSFRINEIASKYSKDKQ